MAYSFVTISILLFTNISKIEGKAAPVPKHHAMKA